MVSKQQKNYFLRMLSILAIRYESYKLIKILIQKSQKITAIKKFFVYLLDNQFHPFSKCHLLKKIELLHLALALFTLSKILS